MCRVPVALANATSDRKPVRLYPPILCFGHGWNGRAAISSFCPPSSMRGRAALFERASEPFCVPPLPSRSGPRDAGGEDCLKLRARQAARSEFRSQVEARLTADQNGFYIYPLFLTQPPG